MDIKILKENFEKFLKEEYNSFDTKEFDGDALQDKLEKNGVNPIEGIDNVESIVVGVKGSEPEVGFGGEIYLAEINFIDDNDKNNVDVKKFLENIIDKLFTEDEILESGSDENFGD